jgi:hypothetical protein
MTTKQVTNSIKFGVMTITATALICTTVACGGVLPTLAKVVAGQPRCQHC